MALAFPMKPQCLLALLGFALLALALPAEVFRHVETGIELPDSFGGYQRGAPRTYGEGTPEAGVSIAFDHTAAAVTLYLRKATGASKDFAEKSVTEGIDAIRAMGMLSQIQPKELPAALKRAGWSGAAVTGRIKDRPASSYILCTMRNGHLVKIRATTRTATDEGLDAFLGKLVEHLDAAKQP